MSAAPPPHAAPGAPPPPDAHPPFRFGRRAVAVDVAFWCFLGVLITVNRHLGDPRGGSPSLPALGFSLYKALLWSAVTPAVFWLAWRFGVDRGGSRPRGAAVLLLGGMAVAAAVAVVEHLGWVHLFGLPRWAPPRRSLLAIVFRPMYVFDLMTYAGVLAAGFAWHYSVRYRARLEESVRLRAQAAELEARGAHLHAQLTEARLHALRSQLDPHFLFNTLNAVSALVARDPRGVRRMISRLSELLRYSLEAPGETEIPLARELEMTSRYMEILEIRFQGRLATRLACEPGLAEARVPAMVLQPLVENAMTHGVSGAGGHGRIEVEARAAGGCLVLRVTDTGPGEGGAGAEGRGSGLGLANTRARLRELYGDGAGVELRPQPAGGMTAEVVLPLRLPAAQAAPACAVEAADG